MTQKEINVTKISFPEIVLQTRDAHKLRGYFGSVFKEHSTLLHNHFDDGSLRYSYPLIQYKVIQHTPTLVAVEEGANLLTQLFLKMKEIKISGEKYPVNSKNIENKKIVCGYSDELLDYHFQTLWMALNQNNFREYQKLNESEKPRMLKQILVGNILSLFKGLDIHLSSAERLMATVRIKEKQTRFKDQSMLAFEGGFTINAMLPPFLGLGKAVSRGFGTIENNK